MKGQPNYNNNNLALAAVTMGVGFALGANCVRVKAFLGYHFPGIFVFGRQRIKAQGCFEEPTATELLDIAEDIIVASLQGKPGGSSLIANVDQLGAPRVRAINPMKIRLRCGSTIHNDGTISSGDEQDSCPTAFFFTNRLSRKRAQFMADSRAELMYFEPVGMSSVRLAGTVEEMPFDQARTLWQPRLKAVIEEGPEEEGRFTTFAFRIHRIEVVSGRHGLTTVERKDWRPYTLLLQDVKNESGQEWVYQAPTPDQRISS